MTMTRTAATRIEQGPRQVDAVHEAAMAYTQGYGEATHSTVWWCGEHRWIGVERRGTEVGELRLYDTPERGPGNRDQV